MKGNMYVTISSKLTIQLSALFLRPRAASHGRGWNRFVSLRRPAVVVVVVSVFMHMWRAALARPPPPPADRRWYHEFHIYFFRTNRNKKFARKGQLLILCVFDISNCTCALKGTFGATNFWRNSQIVIVERQCTKHDPPKVNEPLKQGPASNLIWNKMTRPDPYTYALYFALLELN